MQLAGFKLPTRQAPEGIMDVGVGKFYGGGHHIPSDP